MIDDWIFYGLIGLVALAAVCMVMAGNAEHDERERLVAQCMSDGKKEYECRAMFQKRSGDMVAVPIVVPSGR